MKGALFPGSLNSIALGHFDIIRRVLALFDEVVVAIGINDGEDYMFTAGQCKEFMERVFVDEPKAEVSTYQGLTVDYCRETGAQLILRGFHNPTDFESERTITHANRTLSKIEAVFLLTATRTSFTSSSIVHDVIRNNSDHTVLVPESVKV